MATCPICGAQNLRYFTAWNVTAKPRLEGADGNYHDCPGLQPIDTIQCACGETVQRNHEGRKRNTDGSKHACTRPVPAAIVPQAAPPRPVAPASGWKIAPMKIERHTGV